MPNNDGDRDENRNDCHRALLAQPTLASACGQCQWSVVAGDHGAISPPSSGGASAVWGCTIRVGEGRPIRRVASSARAARAGTTSHQWSALPTTGSGTMGQQGSTRPSSGAPGTRGLSRYPFIPGMVAACRSPTSLSCTVSGVIDTQMLGLGSYVLPACSPWT